MPRKSLGFMLDVDADIAVTLWNCVCCQNQSPDHANCLVILFANSSSESKGLAVVIKGKPISIHSSQLLQSAYPEHRLDQERC